MGSGASGSVNRERKWIIIGAYQFARKNTSVHHSGIYLDMALMDDYIYQDHMRQEGKDGRKREG